LMKPALAVPLALFLCACAAANLDVIQVGPWSNPRSWREVEVFASRSETKRPWGGIGIIHGPKLPANTDKAGLEKMKLAARKSAAAMGADGVIVVIEPADSGAQLGVYEAPEIYLSALAIKYVTEVSTSAAK